MQFFFPVELESLRSHWLALAQQPAWWGMPARKLLAILLAILLLIAAFSCVIMQIPPGHNTIISLLLLLLPALAIPAIAKGKRGKTALVYFAAFSLALFPVIPVVLSFSLIVKMSVLVLLIPLLQVFLLCAMFMALPQGKWQRWTWIVSAAAVLAGSWWVRGSVVEQLAVLLVFIVLALEVRLITLFVMRTCALDLRKQVKILQITNEHEALVRKSMEERSQLEYELFQSRKMEALGQLAGGIAHDFNNVLAAISGYADLLGKRFGEPNPVIARYTRIILEACGRASGMISQLLAYTRRGKYQRRVLDIHECIESVLRLLEQSLTGKVRVRTIFHAKHPWFAGDPDQFQNALINMAINARDAMPTGGDLLLRTANVTLDSSFGQDQGFKVQAGEYVKLEVIDTGVGMDAQVQKRIFEPFFTTKQGKGTGLGLAGVYGFIKSHGGYITVNSAPGKGSTFKIYLPMVEENAQLPLEEFQEGNVNPPEMTPTNNPSSPPLIMVVDDEEPIRELLYEMLQRMGFAVKTFSNAEQALEWYTCQTQNLPDLVILDMIMPGMDGRELYLCLQKHNPSVKALVISGFSRNEQIQELMDAGVIGLLPKPFQYRELSEIVTQVLAKRNC